MRPVLAAAALAAFKLPGGYVRLDQHYKPGFIVLSYLIAFVGSLCTLELLIRRTTNSGWRNQALLAAAGICFGSVSTFAMHFVFNNALALHHSVHAEYPEVYLAYGAGYTVLSLVVSCLVMTAAFFIMGTKCTGAGRGVGKDEYREWKSAQMLRRGNRPWFALHPEAGAGSDGKLENGSKDGTEEQVAYPRQASPVVQTDSRSTFAGHRASLPADILLPSLPSYVRPTALRRIESLSEAECEPVSPSSRHHLASIGAVEELKDEMEQGERRSQRKGSLEAHWGRLGIVLGFDVVTAGEIVKVFVTGITAGLGVVGMHYIGQASIIGIPYMAYQPAYVVGSVIIACSAMVIALYIMFIIRRPKLKHTWWSKIVVALILAVAVCAMHFCGSMGTTYGWPVDKSTERHSQLTGTNVAITGVVAALAFTACIACVVFFVLHSLYLRRELARRRRVVVACVMFDEYNRVLVNSSDGMLPMCDIASLSGEMEKEAGRAVLFAKSPTSGSAVLGMDLSVGHEAFVAALKLSWAWRNQEEWDDDRCHDVAEIGKGSLGQVVGMAGGQATTLSVEFLEKFTASSRHLATRLMGQMDGIARLGVLYDQILTTGWVKLQNSDDIVSKGQLIFLVRRVDSASERFDLESRHYIFADPAAVASALHRLLSVPFDRIMPLLDDARLFCDSTLHCTLQPGKLYAGVAIVQAAPFDGLRVLLETEKRSQLPMREMCTLGLCDSDRLSGTVEEIGEALSMLQGLSMLGVITRNAATDNYTTDSLSRRAVLLSIALERVIIPMLDEMLTAEDMIHILPRLILHPVLVPLTPGRQLPFNFEKRPTYIPPFIIVFYASYDAAVNTFTDKWLPFNLFKAQNACVMAQRIQYSMRMERSWAETAREQMARRTNRVESDLQSSGQVSSNHQTLDVPAFDTGILNAFPFSSKTQGAVSDTSQYTAQQRSSLKQAIPGRVRNGSFARSRLGSTCEGNISPSMEGNPSRPGSVGFEIPTEINAAKDISTRQVSLGVGVWDQDWLLKLLRSKLRAEA
nr:hypothetical protein L204_02572 [Cryptococcus depauperatus CBS 7855]